VKEFVGATKAKIRMPKENQKSKDNKFGMALSF
jgi:hypothetical protein